MKDEGVTEEEWMGRINCREQEEGRSVERERMMRKENDEGERGRR